jgi:hypothetical protein
MVFGSSKRSHTHHRPTEEDESYYDVLEAQLHHYASSDGYLVCHDEVLMKRQKSVAVDIIKAIGKKLMSGKFDLLHVSLPVKIFAARSYLQATCDVFSYSGLLEKAVAASSPEERLKWVVTWAVAGYHRGFSMWGKPFNPILGETYHARLPDGTEACMEQISHHPPVSAFQIIGPGKSYYIHGTSQPRLMYKMSCISMQSDGYRVIEFPSSCGNKVTQIRMGLPTFSIRNVGSSTPQRADVCGKIDFIDTENDLVASIDIGEIQCGELQHGCVQGTLYKKSSHTLDHSKSGRLLMRDVSVSHTNSTDDLYIPISTCRGHWLAHIDWDDERYWTWATDRPQEWTATAKMPDSGLPILPSDSTLREDLLYLAQEDFDRAQEAKERLEKEQRRDAKNRPVHT